MKTHPVRLAPRIHSLRAHQLDGIGRYRGLYFLLRKEQAGTKTRPIPPEDRWAGFVTACSSLRWMAFSRSNTEALSELHSPQDVRTRRSKVGRMMYDRGGMMTMMLTEK